MYNLIIHLVLYSYYNAPGKKMNVLRYREHLKVENP